MLSPGARRLLEAYIDLLYIGVALCVIYYSYQVLIVQVNAGFMMHALPLNLAFAQAALPLGWGLMLIRLVERMGRRFSEKDFAADPMAGSCSVSPWRSAFVGLDVGLVGSVLMIVLVLLIMGCILEPIAAILVVMPILFPIGRQLGFDDIHFGVLVVCTLSVGFTTPPVGINLSAASAVSGQPFNDIAMKAIPSFFAFLIVVFFITASPAVVLWFR